MNFKSILIITYGRSGSTLLQGILNTIPNCIIKGENYNFVYHLFKAYQSLLGAKKINGKYPDQAWFGWGSFSEGKFIKQCINLIKDQFELEEDDHIYGFKEIRYMYIDDCQEYLYFLKKVFPQVAFIFNIREHDQVVKSGWWKNMDPVLVKEELKKQSPNFMIIVREIIILF